MVMVEDRKIQHEMAGDAAWAVHLLRQGWSVELNYSEASVREIENVCKSLWEFIEDEAERNVPMYTERLGAYLGEILHRHLGGQWVMASDRDCSLPPPRANADIISHGPDGQYIERCTPAIRWETGPGTHLTVFPHEQIRQRLTGQCRECLMVFYDKIKGQLGTRLSKH